MDGDSDPATLTAHLESWTVEDETETPLPDDLFKALVSRQRRRILSVLLDRDPISIDDLTDVLVGSTVTIQGPSGPDEWAKVKIELVHAHLPLLVDAGLVRYDRDASEVRLESLAAPVYQMIRFATEYEQILKRNGVGPY